MRKVRAASLWVMMKPDIQGEEMFVSSLGALRGEGDSAQERGLGAGWETPATCLPSKADEATARSHKVRRGHWEVGEAHSSAETPIKSGWSEGALAERKRTQKVLALIGR
jgi:hypothetical protein